MTRIYRFFSNIFTLFLVFASALSIAKPRERSKTEIQPRFSGNVIAWDLHDVLFFGKPSLFKAFWHYPHKRKLLPKGKMRNIVWKEIKRSLFGGKKRLNSSELITLAKKHNAPDIAEFVMQYETSCTPDSDMVSLIKELHQRGFRQYICSNISAQGFEILKERYPEVFQYFEGTYTTHQNNSRKPHNRFFELFLETYGLQPQDILFIDDKRDNCVAARKLGMTTVRFLKKQGKRYKSIMDIKRLTTRTLSHKRVAAR